MQRSTEGGYKPAFTLIAAMRLLVFENHPYIVTLANEHKASNVFYDMYG